MTHLKTSRTVLYQLMVPYVWEGGRRKTFLHRNITPREARLANAFFREIGWPDRYVRTRKS